MHSFDVRENLQVKEANLKAGDNGDANMGLPLDLLREGQNMKFADTAQACKAGYPQLPELSLTGAQQSSTMNFKPAGETDNYVFTPEEQAAWAGDLYAWSQRVLEQLKDAGIKIGKKLENINPQDLLDVAQDMAKVVERFGPQIGSDIKHVIQSKGLDPTADAKLIIDLVDLAKSPEVAKLSEDARKILKEFQQIYGLN